MLPRQLHLNSVYINIEEGDSSKELSSMMPLFYYISMFLSITIGYNLSKYLKYVKFYEMTIHKYTNKEITQKLKEVVAAMEVKGDSFFKIRAYHTAILSIETLTNSVLELWEKDALAGLLKKYDPSTIKDTVAGLKKWTIYRQNHNLTMFSQKVAKFMRNTGKFWTNS
jgi:hypothetical protein